jgi:hypothetical protein
MGTWYNAFDQFVRSALDKLDISTADKTVTAWLRALHCEPTPEEMRRIIVEGYFNTIVHELANSPSILEKLNAQMMYTATRSPPAPCEPTLSQHTFATMLSMVASGSTVRFDAVHNHPWSHWTDPALVQIVAVFQSTISTISAGSSVHPSNVETSIAW